MASATITKRDPAVAIPDVNIVDGIVTRVTWSVDSEPNTAEIQMPKKRFHEFREYNAGKQIRINIVKGEDRNLIFQGWITGRFFEYTPDSEMVSVICSDPRWYLQGDFVKGKCMVDRDGTYRIQTAYKCLFNERVDSSEQPTGNAAIAKVVAGDFAGVRPFSLNLQDAGQSQAYTVNEMLYYIYKIGRMGHSPSILDECIILDEHGIGSLGENILYDVNVDGNNITEAMDTVLKRAGLKWWCKPRSTTTSELKVFQSGIQDDIPYKYLDLADVATGVSPTAKPTLADISSSTNNTEAGRANEDYSSVYNRVHVYGSPGRYSFNFTLIPGWSETAWDALKIQDIKIIRNALREKGGMWTENPEYAKIGRYWILNEDGGKPGTVYDFNDAFGHTAWSRTLRPFAGQRVDGIDIQTPRVKNPFGQTVYLEATTRLMQDRAGVYIDGDEITPEIFDEKTKALATELYIKLVVDDDIALEKVARVDGKNILVNEVTKETTAVRGWLTPKVGDDAINRRLCILADQFTFDNVNTTKANESQNNIEAFAIAKLKENKDPAFSASFTIPWITTSYEPGDQVGGISGRNLWFIGKIVEVHFDFLENQRTEIVIEDLRLSNAW